jgi:hypothetical protein
MLILSLGKGQLKAEAVTDNTYLVGCTNQHTDFNVNMSKWTEHAVIHSVQQKSSA